MIIMIKVTVIMKMTVIIIRNWKQFHTDNMVVS